MQDDIYEGRFIPAGTTVIENVWWVLIHMVCWSPHSLRTIRALFLGLFCTTRVYTRTLKPLTLKDSSKAEVSTPKSKTLRSSCLVTEGGTFSALCHRSSPSAASTDTCVSHTLCSVCPGKGFAVRMLFTTIACTIATFDIKKAVDEHGDEVTPNPEFNPGIIM